jgi:adenosylmethionine-8-amino-7-oxononanoate aminotransferase
MSLSDADLEFDRNHIWHPYTSAIDPLPTYPVAGAEGAEIILEDGRRLIDGMASWWSAIHGYDVPELNKAATDQLDQMAHVMFGGTTHEPAVRLSQRLVEMTPDPLQRVFPADSGSVSMEVALKMAIQYWAGRGRPSKQKFVTPKFGYHGDTFGAMSVCDPENGMHSLFSDFMAQNFFIEAPALGYDREVTDADFDELESVLENHADEIAALTIEPVVQGAGGMRIYSPRWLEGAVRRCRAHDVLVIFDEIAVGFGRTGEMFGVDHIDAVPDIMTVGKAMTGGYCTLAATLCTDEVSHGVCESEAGVFMHGPTFMGNPLACSISNANIEKLQASDWRDDVARLEEGLRDGLTPAHSIDGVEDVRVLGGVGVIEVDHTVDTAALQAHMVDRGVWVRPFSTLIYVMPPYILNSRQLRDVTDAMVSAAELSCEQSDGS